MVETQEFIDDDTKIRIREEHRTKVDLDVVPVGIPDELYVVDISGLRKEHLYRTVKLKGLVRKATPVRPPMDLALKSATASHVTPIDRLPSGYSLATFCISSPYVGILFESTLSPLQFGHIFVAGSASSSSASLPITILPSPLHAVWYLQDVMSLMTF